MSRGMVHAGRPLAVWLVVTYAALVAGRTVPAAWRTAGGGAQPGEVVADALVAGCATVLAVALGWVWLVTSATVAQVVLGATPAGAGTTRRLVLLACGAAIVAGVAAPAAADGGRGDARRAAEQLVGLSLPERAVAPADPSAEARTRPVAVTRTEPGHDDRYVVRPGDSLWSIARAHPGDGGDVGLRWRAIWAANRDVVGADPDLIHPGQELRLPGTHPRTRTDEDGAR